MSSGKNEWSLSKRSKRTCAAVSEFEPLSEKSPMQPMDLVKRRKAVAMENVSEEMKHFFEACEILLHDMYPRDFSVKECSLIEHYTLELYVRYGSRRS
jgi:hypothetical protein